MTIYDPETTPDPAAWLALDEQLRLALIEQYHRRRRIRMPNVRVHAVMHGIIENQLAEDDEVVAATLVRLRQQGLSRHEAIHAIASVLVNHLYDLLSPGRAPDRFDTRAYYEDLQRLTADAWRQSG